MITPSELLLALVLSLSAEPRLKVEGFIAMPIDRGGMQLYVKFPCQMFTAPKLAANMFDTMTNEFHGMPSSVTFVNGWTSGSVLPCPPAWIAHFACVARSSF